MFAPTGAEKIGVTITFKGVPGHTYLFTMDVCPDELVADVGTPGHGSWDEVYNHTVSVHPTADGTITLTAFAQRPSGTAVTLPAARDFWAYKWEARDLTLFAITAPPVATATGYVNK